MEGPATEDSEVSIEGAEEEARGERSEGEELQERSKGLEGKGGKPELNSFSSASSSVFLPPFFPSKGAPHRYRCCFVHLTLLLPCRSRLKKVCSKARCLPNLSLTLSPPSRDVEDRAAKLINLYRGTRENIESYV